MNYSKKTVYDAPIAGKKVLLRCDFNVPQDKETGAITSDKRIVAALPTIKYLLENGAAVIVKPCISLLADERLAHHFGMRQDVSLTVKVEILHRVRHLGEEIAEADLGKRLPINDTAGGRHERKHAVKSLLCIHISHPLRGDLA